MKPRWGKNYFESSSGVAAARQRRANFLYAFSVFEFAFAFTARSGYQNFSGRPFRRFYPRLRLFTALTPICISLNFPA